jgi:hypothetical protein
MNIQLFDISEEGEGLGLKPLATVLAIWSRVLMNKIAKDM